MLVSRLLLFTCPASITYLSESEEIRLCYQWQPLIEDIFTTNLRISYTKVLGLIFTSELFSLVVSSAKVNTIVFTNP